MERAHDKLAMSEEETEKLQRELKKANEKLKKKVPSNGSKGMTSSTTDAMPLYMYVAAFTCMGLRRLLIFDQQRYLTHLWSTWAYLLFKFRLWLTSDIQHFKNWYPASYYACYLYRAGA